MTSVEIRCHGCSHSLGRVGASMHLVALFKPSAVGRVASVHRHELRRRCGSCGWVNVFHPEQSTDVVQVKSTNIRTDSASVEHSAPGPLMAAHTITPNDR